MGVRERIAKRRVRRTFRVRNQVRASASGRLRMSVFRSNKHMYAQIIDDVAGRTVVAASTLDKAVVGSGKYAGNKDAAAQVGKLLAERAAGQGIKTVVFDRGRYKYHGRVASLAEAARAGGLEF